MRKVLSILSLALLVSSGIYVLAPYAQAATEYALQVFNEDGARRRIGYKGTGLFSAAMLSTDVVNPVNGAATQLACSTTSAEATSLTTGKAYLFSASNQGTTNVLYMSFSTSASATTSTGFVLPAGESRVFVAPGANVSCDMSANTATLTWIPLEGQ